MDAHAPFLADLVLPGTKPVEHRLVLDPGPHGTEWRFLAFPVRGFGGVEHVLPEQPFEFSSKYGTRIYAVRPDETVPERPDAEWITKHPVGAIPVSEVHAVGLADPLSSVETRLRVDGVDATAVRLSIVGEEREHAWPPFLTWAVPAGGVALGVFLLLCFVRRRSARTA